MAERRSERLHIRRATAELDGRPDAPTLADALRAHPFLVHDGEYDTLKVRPGGWDVDGDLILPTGYGLEVPPDVRLRFAPGAAFASFGETVTCGGVEGHEVVFEPQVEERGWGGIVVADTGTRTSAWGHTVVRGADRIVRGSWQTTGGVTFYRAPTRQRFVRIEGARGEDALNVFAADVDLMGCTIDGGPSDLFDGDFITGTIAGCTFQNAGEDGVDFSGSDVTIEACRFVGLGDKAISVGERTRADVRNCIVESASIGVAAKDLSTVTITGLTLKTLDNFGIAAFIKKPEFGPSTVTATGIVPGGSFGRAPFLVQTGCEVVVDGTAIATQDVDVKRLYEQKVLGK